MTGNQIIEKSPDLLKGNTQCYIEDNWLQGNDICFFSY